MNATLTTATSEGPSAAPSAGLSVPMPSENAAHQTTVQRAVHRLTGPGAANADPAPRASAVCESTTSAAASADASASEPDRDRKYHLSLSTLAARKAYEALRKRGTPQAAIRVGVRGGGCSGFQYVIEFADQPPRTDRDLVFSFPVERQPGDDEAQLGNVRVLCDRKSILFLNDTTLHWEKSLMWQGFRFLNPQEKSSCGCKQSFTV